MSLTSENLVGYLQAEFARASKLRVVLFFVQLAVAVPGAASVLVPDSKTFLLYVLAILSAALLFVWWVLNGMYTRARAAAQAARRAALLLGGLADPLSPSEVQSLRERFTVTAAAARKCEKADYYSTKLPAGPARLAEMLEESALYTEHLQRYSSYAMLVVLLLFTAAFIVIALAVTPFVERDTVYIVIRTYLAMSVFVMSSDVVGAYRAHKAAANDIRDIRKRLMVADRAGYSSADVLLAFLDYNSAVEGAPESVPFIYAVCAKELDQRWHTYQADRAAARAGR